MKSGYVVLDVETTGFSPARGDRVIEIALHTLDKNRKIKASYHTLINPNRDVSATHIHGITASMVKDAPTFGEIVGNVLSPIKDRTIVAHNASFDKRFLISELRRLNIDIDDYPNLCTLKLARYLFPELPSKKLYILCKYLDIPSNPNHSAYEDSRATALLFDKMVESLYETSGDKISSFIVGHYPDIQWEHYKPSERSTTREQKTEDRPNTLAKLLKRVPDINDERVECVEYQWALDNVLLDRRVDKGEIENLVQIAHDLKLSRSTVTKLHEDYLRKIVKITLLDGRITKREMSDIFNVSYLLGIPDNLTERMIEEMKNKLKGNTDTKLINLDAIVDKSVCFTGDFTATVGNKHVNRSEIQRIAIENGMVVKNGVTKKLDYLVAADPHTLSTKAKKARKYKIKIVSEDAFYRMIGIQVD
ncbi:MAG: DNA polymerase III subunit epsilon [Candidatus Syntrophoarchaeum sp. GoM_oil]|nr:MAG: DNA polymerase III subunit epsilon [Candidatus Syntrophoarchaeum sp. GoM_oil]